MVDILHENRHVFSAALILEKKYHEELLEAVKDSKLLSTVVERLLGVYKPIKPQLDETNIDFLDRPFIAAGFLREQVERIYWSTVWNGFPALPDPSNTTDETSSVPHRPMLPVSGDQIPECLRPNLEITTIDGSVSCHDWVLVPRWKFVRHMFLFAGEETHSRRISLEDVGITSDALRYILYYMYTDRVDLLDDEHLKLSIHKWSAELYLTDFEDVALPGCERLIHHTSKSFAHPLTLENSVPTFRAAVEGGSQMHEERALKFIAKNLKTIMESDRRLAEMQTLDPIVLSKIMFLHFKREYQPPMTQSTPEDTS